MDSSDMTIDSRSSAEICGLLQIDREASGKMKVIKAKTAGFCFGVKRAVETVYEQVEYIAGTSPIYTYGPIIHNEEGDQGPGGIRACAVLRIGGSAGCAVGDRHGDHPLPRRREKDL